jgi:sec-independent protein translocase protein TatB
VFGISMWELGLILLVALILLGPRQLTETAKVMGKLYRDLQRLTSDLRNSVDLDSLTNPTYSKESNQQKTEESSDRYKDKEISPVPGEKSGPDFYADLLESSRTEDEKKAEAASSPESPEAGKVTAETEPDTPSDKESPKKERT